MSSTKPKHNGGENLFVERQEKSHLRFGPSESTGLASTVP